MRFGKAFIISCVLSAIPLSVLAQTSLEDSLTAEVLSTKNTHDKIILMDQLAFHYEDEDPQKALEVAFQAYGLAELDEDIVFTTNLIGVEYLNLELYDSALYYFQSAYDLASEINDSTYIAKSLSNMGVVQFSIGNYEKGLSLMNEGAMIDQAIGNYEMAMESFMNLGGVHFQLKNYSNSKDYSLKAMEIAQFIGDKKTEADVCGTIGAVEFRLKNPEVGKEWFNRAILLHEEEGDLSGVQRDYYNLATIYKQEEKNKIAEVYYLKSLEYAEKSDSPSTKRDLYLGLARNNEEMGKDGMALDYYKKFMGWKDTVIERENTKVLIEMQEKFNSEQTEKENELLIQQNQIKDLENQKSRAQLNQSRVLVFASAIGLVLLVIIAVVLFNRNRLKQRANLELQQAHDIIQEKNEDITASIEYASKIQEALLPTKENTVLFKDSYFILEPKDIVSGDFLWYAEVGDKVVFAAADCTGHGVPGAFMSMIGNSFLHQIVKENNILQPSLILDGLRERVIVALSQQDGQDARKDGMDIALCVLDKSSGILEFAGANNPLYYVKDGEMIEIKGDKMPVGYMPERNGPFTNHKIQLSTGDALYIFSDGFADQFGGPKGKKFKYKQMRELMHEHYDKEMKVQKEIMLSAFHEWKGDMEQIDDVCVIGVRV
jgi:serine phosphatase RsbU (regulator of sigma subunit)